MDSQPTYDDLPWDLIASAIQGELTPDEDLRFREWLALAGHQEKYDRLLQVWKDGMTDYAMYQEADEGKAWEVLQTKMNGNAPVISLKRWMAAAAVILLTAGAGWWYFSEKGTTVQYATAAHEQKAIPLVDGSTIVMQPQTNIRVAPNYNKTTRTVTLISGEAHFDVSHQEQRPFTVDMDAASVKDIGTSFTIEKTNDSIKVSVSSGKIAFMKKATGESREIAAGGSICLYTTALHAGEIKTTGAINSGADSLRFDDAPLSEVITALQKQSGKRIRLTDTLVAQKRLTVHLEGESFDDAIKVICASLHLELVRANGEYILKPKDTATHH